MTYNCLKQKAFPPPFFSVHQVVLAPSFFIFSVIIEAFSLSRFVPSFAHLIRPYHGLHELIFSPFEKLVIQDPPFISSQFREPTLYWRVRFRAAHSIRFVDPWFKIFLHSISLTPPIVFSHLHRYLLLLLRLRLQAYSPYWPHYLGSSPFYLDYLIIFDLESILRHHR